MKSSIKFLVMLVSTLVSLAAQAQDQQPHRPRVGDIRPEEVKRVNTRIESHHFTTFGFGPYGSSTSNKGGMMYGLSYGRTWEGSETGEIRFDINGAANSDSQFFNLGLGYGFIPSTEDISPIIGGELGLGYAGYKKDGDSKSRGGFTAGAFGGIRFFRTADTQLELLAKYNAVIAEDSPGVYGIELRLLF